MRKPPVSAGGFFWCAGHGAQRLDWRCQPVAKAIREVTRRWKSSGGLGKQEPLAEQQGRRREAGSEGSVEQSRDSTDRNRIRGSYGRTSEQKVTKSISVKGHGCKFGECAVKAVGLTPGGLLRVVDWRLREP